MNLTTPIYLTEKDGLLYVRTTDEQYIHQSFPLPTGEVLVFESIPTNYPSNALVTFDTVEAYLETIRSVGWINDEDNIVKHQLETYGFPFKEA